MGDVGYNPNDHVGKKLHSAQKLQIADMHCDTILGCCGDGVLLKDWKGHIDPQKLSVGGCLVQCFALFIPTFGPNGPTPDDRKDTPGGTHPPHEAPWPLYQKLVDCYNKSLEELQDVIRPAYSASDIRANAAQGLMSSILTVEDCVEIDGQLDRFDAVYRDGVRMMALTWNFENCIGFPNSADPELHKKGLKPFGFDAVEKMNDLGIVVDVSHLSEGGFWNVAEHSKKPFAASHSCCRSLCGHQRNLTDDQLRCIADHGGVVGVNFCGDFLREGSKISYISDIVRHLEHMRNVGGTDLLAWGSDFDGIDSTLEYEDYAGFPLLIRALEDIFSPAELDKLNHQNFLRLLSDQ